MSMSALELRLAIRRAAREAAPASVAAGDASTPVETEIDLRDPVGGDAGSAELPDEVTFDRAWDRFVSLPEATR